MPAPEDVARLGPQPPGVEVEAFPPEPLASPRLGEVEVLIPPYEPTTGASSPSCPGWPASGWCWL